MHIPEDWELEEAAERYEKKRLDSWEKFLAIQQIELDLKREYEREQNLKKAGPMGVFYDYEFVERFRRNYGRSRRNYKLNNRRK